MYKFLIYYGIQIYFLAIQELMFLNIVSLLLVNFVFLHGEKQGGKVTKVSVISPIKWDQFSCNLLLILHLILIFSFILYPPFVNVFYP